MKKVSVFLLGMTIAVAGCSKESIISNSGSTASTTPSTDTDSFANDEDEISNTSFDRTISIVWSSSSATVSGDAKGIVSVSGADVTVDNTGTTEKVKYELSGSSSSGSLKLYSNNKQALVLNGLSLTNPSGAAINNQGKKRCYVVVSGTNALADGSSAAYSATGEEDLKAVFFSEGQLIFSGSGSLTVTANNAQGKAGITSDDYVRVLDTPTITVTAGSSAGHGLRGKDAVAVDGGTLSITVAAAMKKGITSDSLVVFNGGATTIKATGGTAYDSEDSDYKASAGVKADQVFKMNAGTLTVTNSGQGGKGITGDAVAYFNGGTVSVTVTGSNYGSSSGGGGGFGPRATTTTDNSKSAKAIKFDGDIHFNGGTVNATASNHEAIESKGAMDITGGAVYGFSKADDGINCAGNLTITGGSVCAYSAGNDGMDANGNLYIKGGFVYAIGTSSPEVGIDANSEGGYQIYLTGGTLVAIGGLENGASLSQSCYSASSWNKNTWYSITVGSTTHAFKTPSSGGSGMVVSGASQPTVQSGVTTSGGTSIWDGMGVLDCSVSGGSSVSLGSYSGGGGMGGGGNQGGGPGGRPW
ncbi:MAG: carbohydrate-binding domain-containing protein [Bacteroidales bacterium]|nr:carbohydrate-binding domain-containing protein [Bacteroidales bacterium]